MMASFLSSFLSKRYLVRLDGQNFRLQSDESIKRMSFVTTRFVDAEDEKQATEKAKARVLSELSPLNTDDDPPTLKAYEIFRVRWLRRRFRRQGGFTFYDEIDDKPPGSGAP